MYRPFFIFIYIHVLSKAQLNGGNNLDEDKQDLYPQDFIHLIAYV